MVLDMRYVGEIINVMNNEMKSRSRLTVIGKPLTKLKNRILII